MNDLDVKNSQDKHHLKVDKPSVTIKKQKHSERTVIQENKNFETSEIPAWLSYNDLHVLFDL